VNLYHELIVEHGKRPHHAGTLAAATHAATIDNPLCGDVVTVQLLVENARIADVAHSGHGCALSIASASLLADRLIGLTLADARAVLASFEAMIATEPDAPDRADELGPLAAFAGVRAFRSRRACATLPARAVMRSLEHGMLAS
jgi:nitrogen fixation protein NifU and related proteins